MSQERDTWHLNLLLSLQLQLLQIAEMLPKGEEGQAEGGVNRFFFNLEDEKGGITSERKLKQRLMEEKCGW